MAAATQSLVLALAAVVPGKDERWTTLRQQDQTRHVLTILPSDTDRLAGQCQISRRYHGSRPLGWSAVVGVSWKTCRPASSHRIHWVSRNCFCNSPCYLLKSCGLYHLQPQVPAYWLELKQGAFTCELWRVAGNTVWSHMVGDTLYSSFEIGFPCRAVCWLRSLTFNFYSVLPSVKNSWWESNNQTYWLCYSGGKDSCFNLMHCAAEGHELVALANLKPANKGTGTSAVNIVFFPLLVYVYVRCIHSAYQWYFSYEIHLSYSLS